jgi:hypothetical protein
MEPEMIKSLWSWYDGEPYALKGARTVWRGVNGNLSNRVTWLTLRYKSSTDGVIGKAGRR